MFRSFSIRTLGARCNYAAGGSFITCYAGHHGAYGTQSGTKIGNRDLLIAIRRCRIPIALRI